MYTSIGDYPNALASHKQCVLLARQSQCQLSEARQLGNVGAVYTALGDFANALKCHEQHLEVAKVTSTVRAAFLEWGWGGTCAPRGTWKDFPGVLGNVKKCVESE